MCSRRLSRVQQEKKILSTHTTTHSPSEINLVEKVSFKFQIEGY
jgi:hypothetical protein